MAGSRKKKAAASSAASASTSASSSPTATALTAPPDPIFSPLTVTLPATVRSLSECPALFTVPLPSDCTLASIVCSYGFFRLPPNTWIPPNATLHRITPLFSGGGVQLSDAGTARNGCFIRALRFGDREEDAIFVAVTQEDVVKDEDEKKAAVPVAEQHVEVAVQLADGKEESDTAALLTYHTNQHIVVRAIQPPYSHLSALTTTPNQPPSSYTFTLQPTHLTSLQYQTCRMLRLSPHPSPPDTPNPYGAFYALVPTARRRGFARLFRSPSTFEDLLKTVTLCNIHWAGTIAINDALCGRVGLGAAGYGVEVEVVGPTERDAVAAVAAAAGVEGGAEEPGASMGRSAMSEVMRGGEQTEEAEGGGVRHRIRLGTFPSPWEIASVPDAELREKCRVGYRSQRIIRLGERFAHENLDQQLTALLAPDTPTDAVYRFLLSIDGFGPFAASNALAMLGRFDSHAFDSETVRHMREHHRFDPHFQLTSDAVLRHAREHYSAARYGRFVFLVYWHELWAGYEARVRCRAEQWTQEAFASFSNGGGGKQSQSQSHARKVAEQTRKRKARGLTAAAFNARKKTANGAAGTEEAANKENEVPAAEEADGQQQEVHETAVNKRGDIAAESAETVGKRRLGRTLKDMMMRSVKPRRGTPARKVTGAAEQQPHGEEGRRMTRAASKRLTAEVVECKTYIP